MRKSNLTKLTLKLFTLAVFAGCLFMFSGERARAYDCDVNYEQCYHYCSGDDACIDQCSLSYMSCVADNGGWDSDPHEPYQDGPSGGPRRPICVPCNMFNACMAGSPTWVAARDACVASGGTAGECCASLVGL